MGIEEFDFEGVEMKSCDGTAMACRSIGRAVRPLSLMTVVSPTATKVGSGKSEIATPPAARFRRAWRSDPATKRDFT
jgi:hypothetical protein